MKIVVRPRSRNQVVCPIRFYRVVEGPEFPNNVPDPAKPEVDDRAFGMGTRPATWSNKVERGAMVGLAVNDTVQIKIRFEDLDRPLELDTPPVPVFVTSTDPSVVEVLNPEKGKPLDFDGVFSIKGKKDVVKGQVAIQARLGGESGPVLGELEPHIFTMLKLRIRAHLVTIASSQTRSGGVATDHTAEGFTKLVELSNAIWRPAGIQFLYNPAETSKSAETAFLSTAGQVTLFEESDRDSKREAAVIFGMNSDSRAINVYCVPEIVDLEIRKKDSSLVVFGEGAKPGSSARGILITNLIKGGSGRVLAHELGHFLGLDHSDEKGKVRVREDMWSARRLMFSSTSLPPAPPHRNNVGWGPGQPGFFLTLKHLEKDPEDGEVARARRQARQERALASG